ncbi:hypothetical protein T484DRAFT_1615739, partial [Baffinella frigidus]
MAPISRFPIISRGQLLCTALYVAASLVTLQINGSKDFVLAKNGSRHALTKPSSISRGGGLQPFLSPSTFQRFLSPSTAQLFLAACHRVTLSPCHLATLAPWHLGTWPPCHLVTLSPCHLVTLSPCHLVTLSPC